MILALTFIQNSGSQASKQYDPWMDINDDGRIDMRDITQLCLNFMATGDPTKNVNVTNWLPQRPKVLLYGVWDLIWNSTGSVPVLRSGGGWLYVGDYERISILVEFYPIDIKSGFAYWSTYIWWSPDGYTLLKREELSTVGFLWDNYVGEDIRALTVRPIVAPYIWISPICLGRSLNATGRAQSKIWVYLSYGSIDDYTSNKFNTKIYGEGILVKTNALVGLFKEVCGFKKVTISFWSNATVTVRVAGDVRPWDQFSLTGGPIIKDYDVYGSKICLWFSNATSTAAVRIDYFMLP
jgi:hypothetical protein